MKNTNFLLIIFRRKNGCTYFIYPAARSMFTPGAERPADEYIGHGPGQWAEAKPVAVNAGKKCVVSTTVRPDEGRQKRALTREKWKHVKKNRINTKKPERLGIRKHTCRVRDVGRPCQFIHTRFGCVWCAVVLFFRVSLFMYIFIYYIYTYIFFRRFSPPLRDLGQRRLPPPPTEVFTARTRHWWRGGLG